MIDLILERCRSVGRRLAREHHMSILECVQLVGGRYCRLACRVGAATRWCRLVVLALLVLLGSGVAACAPDAHSESDAGGHSIVEPPKRTAIRFEEPMEVFDVLESFLINVPRTVPNVWFDETSIRTARDPAFEGITNERRLEFLFTNAVLEEASRIYRELPEFNGFQELYDSYVNGFARCLRDSPFPDITWFGFYSDEAISSVDTVPPRDYIVLEGRELAGFQATQAECAQYAATYPTLDPDYRDELLRPQRDHFVQELRKYLLANPQSVIPLDDSKTDYGIFGGWRILPDGGQYSVEYTIY